MREVCILHGNCQGETLQALLSASPEFVERYAVEYYVNFTRQAIPPSNLSRCALFLHQHLGENWGAVSSAALRGALPATARSVCFPNILFKGYWPFWSNRPGFDYADSFLDALLERGLNPAEALRVATHSRLDKAFDLPALLAETFALERQKEARSDIAYVDVIEAHFREEKLLNSINHPGRRLMFHVADEVLALLGMPPLGEEIRALCPSLYPEFELPIHPQVAAQHGLAFGREGTRFNVYGQALTYAGYAGLYLACKQAGRSDFVNFLQGGGNEHERTEKQLS